MIVQHEYKICSKDIVFFSLSLSKVCHFIDNYLSSDIHRTDRSCKPEETAVHITSTISLSLWISKTNHYYYNLHVDKLRIIEALLDGHMNETFFLLSLIVESVCFILLS